MKHSQLSLERTFVGGPPLPQVGHFYKQRSNNKTDVATGSFGWFCLAGTREWRILDAGRAATLSLTPGSEHDTRHASSLTLSTGPELPQSLHVEPQSELQGCSCPPPAVLPFTGTDILPRGPAAAGAEPQPTPRGV